MDPVAPSQPPPPLSWWGWGDPAKVPDLPEAVLTLLRDGLGVTHSRPHPASAADVVLAPPQLGAELAGALRAAAGPGAASDDEETRLRHAIGRSTPDLYALRSAEPVPAPDLVLSPADHDAVAEVLGVASRERVAVVPFGGGTSVVGGLTPEGAGHRAWVALDLRRLNHLLDLDEESRLAVMEPGLRGPEAEALLAERGYTIGHFPQSFQYATLGGFAAARSSGQASAGYGRFDELVMALRAATPTGTLTLGRAPRSAAGPDLRQLLLGSEGILGVITELTLAVRPAPERKVYDGWRFSSFTAGASALRRLAQDGPRPTVLRLSDEAETALNLARPDAIGAEGQAGGCLGIVGYEGTEADVEQRRTHVTELLRSDGAELDEEAGAAWGRGRYEGPYLRDAMLDAGALVETLETVTFWSRLSHLYTAVGDALRQTLTEAGTPPVVLCHISHVYPNGASLYFTVGCAAAEDPTAQWRAAKAAASDAILTAGGSISHHHGVGRDHQPWYAREIGPLASSVLRAVKAELDPRGVLNPGVLVHAEQ